MNSELTAARVEHPKATRWILGAVGVAALLGAGLFVRHQKSGQSGAPPAGSAGAEARPVPVVVTTASLRDVPVFLDGLGTRCRS